MRKCVRTYIHTYWTTCCASAALCRSRRYMPVAWRDARRPQQETRGNAITRPGLCSSGWVERSTLYMYSVRSSSTYTYSVPICLPTWVQLPSVDHGSAGPVSQARFFACFPRFCTVICGHFKLFKPWGLFAGGPALAEDHRCWMPSLELETLGFTLAYESPVGL